MRTFLLVAWALALLSLPFRSDAAALTSDEQAFFDKHLSDLVKVEPKRVSDPAVQQVFKAPIYDVTIEIMQGDGTETSHLTVARNGAELIKISMPSTNEDLPQLKGLINSQFKLHSDGDAKMLEKAIDALYPLSSFDRDDAKAKAIKHQGSQWTLVRGTFFKKHKGFVFTTDTSGNITAVKYSLDLP